MLAGAKTMRARDRIQIRRGWLTTLRRYFFATAIANLPWEFAQMPLFTLWRTGTPGQVAFAALHCTAGDVGVAAASLALALGLFGAPDWPQQRLAPVVVTATIISVAYATYSEFVNTVIREAWVYSSLMPVVPGLRIGLAPLVQWLIVPPLALIWAMHAVRAAKFPAANENAEGRSLSVAQCQSCVEPQHVGEVR
jgi:hypothetical protein